MTGKFPNLPDILRRQAAFVLASPATTSDALLLFADALDEARSQLTNYALRAAIDMVTYLRDQAPLYANRPLP